LHCKYIHGIKLDDSTTVETSKVRTDSSTAFGSNPVMIDRIRIELVAGLNLILIVQIRTALDCMVDYNECITAFTTG